jgi:hypothetical protein
MKSYVRRKAMEELNAFDDTGSYLQLGLIKEGKGKLYLMVPTYYDAAKKKWLAAIQTPDTKRLIHAFGIDSKELEQNFNVAISEAIDAIPEEVLSMFKALEFWEVCNNCKRVKK